MEYVTDKTINPIPSGQTNGVFQAAMVCQRYNPDGETAGQWYLPAAGELWNYFELNKDAVNTALQNYGGLSFSVNNDPHWCSSEQNAFQTYYIAIRPTISSLIQVNSKRQNFRVRAFIQL